VGYNERSLRKKQFTIRISETLSFQRPKLHTHIDIHIMKSVLLAQQKKKASLTTRRSHMPSIMNERDHSYADACRSPHLSAEGTQRKGTSTPELNNQTCTKRALMHHGYGAAGRLLAWWGWRHEGQDMNGSMATGEWHCR
jgi:hypothetical protein